jgi:NADH-quinone oxidoreductase subunit N
VGIPPFAGFFGKLLLFGAAIDASYAWLAVIAILNSVLSLAVYLRIIVPMYRSAAYAGQHCQQVSSLVWIVALVLTLVIGVAAEPVTSSLGG